MNNDFSIKWLDFTQFENEIISFRKNIFVDELKRDESAIRSEYDESGLHLALLKGEMIVGLSSSYLIYSGDPLIGKINLKPVKPDEVCVQTTKRGALPEFRGLRLNEIKELVTGAQIIDLFNPAYFFATLLDDLLDVKLAYYKKMFGFNFHCEVDVNGVKTTIIISEGSDNYDFVLGHYNKILNENNTEFNVSIPSLVEHLAGNKRITNKMKNLKIKPEYKKILFGD